MCNLLKCWELLGIGAVKSYIGNKKFFHVRGVVSILILIEYYKNLRWERTHSHSTKYEEELYVDSTSDRRLGFKKRLSQDCPSMVRVLWSPSIVGKRYLRKFWWVVYAKCPILLHLWRGKLGPSSWFQFLITFTHVRGLGWG